jgi:hypothetical protein
MPYTTTTETQRTQRLHREELKLGHYRRRLMADERGKFGSHFFRSRTACFLYWTITEASVEADGRGQAKVESYDELKKARVSLEIRTEDFGQSWHVKL